MDRLEEYRRVIQEIVARYGELTPSHGQIQTMPICDVASDNYLLLDIGWDPTGRVYAVVFHLQIRDCRIWVQQDGTEDGICQELLDAGVPREDIVLGFYRSERRALTEFAVA